MFGVRQLVRHSQRSRLGIGLDRNSGYDLALVRRGESVSFEIADVNDERDLDRLFRLQERRNAFRCRVRIRRDTRRAAANLRQRAGIFRLSRIEQLVRNLVALRGGRNRRESVILFPELPAFIRRSVFFRRFVVKLQEFWREIFDREMDRRKLPRSCDRAPGKQRGN
jgi:hypothetical protein